MRIAGFPYDGQRANAAGYEPPTSHSHSMMHKKQGGSPGRFNREKSKRHNHILILGAALPLAILMA